ncbi:MAG: alpha/beta hydrolase [Candidatus Bipolaricaulota bacterium]|nr:alpha/beta hydrolase [Candidatus Bipolaricaulota bacterium]MBS3792640.1 alpha/beta hydrolase [Candidatus Bipolaricaulota bacterium]
MREKFGKHKLPLTAIVAAILVAGLGVTAWFLRPQQVMSEVSESLEGTEAITVSEFELDNVEGILLKPVEGAKRVSVIFYPGARVPVKAYAPTALEIAGQGYEVYLVKMPLNLAILGWKKAGKVIDSRNRSRNWVLAGHSMGGAMAARFISKTDYPVSGLVLWAAYPPEGSTFSSSLKVLSITGGKDEILSDEKVERSRGQFPESAEFFEVEGANHSQFGWYGFQTGDGQATISRKEQTKLVSRLTTDFLDQL